MRPLCDLLPPAGPAFGVGRRRRLNDGRLLWLLAVPPLDGGGKWYDLCGLSHGTLTGMSNTSEGWAAAGRTRPGAVGPAPAFAALGHAVNLSPAYAALGDFTLAAWVYDTRTLASTQPVVMGLGGHAWQVQTNGVPSYWDGSAAVNSTGAITASAWAHLALTRSGSTLTHWVNGVAAGTGTIATPQPALSLVGSYASATANNWWGGFLDDLSVWGRCLTAQEVRALYDDSRAGHPLTLAWPAAPPAAGGGAPGPGAGGPCHVGGGLREGAGAGLTHVGGGLYE